MAALNILEYFYRKVFQMPHAIISSDPQNNPSKAQELVSGVVGPYPRS